MTLMGFSDHRLSYRADPAVEALLRDVALSERACTITVCFPKVGTTRRLSLTAEQARALLAESTRPG